jgi:hypothetical protein
VSLIKIVLKLLRRNGIVGIKAFCLIHSLIIYQNPSKEIGNSICRTCVLNQIRINGKSMDYQYLQMVKAKLLKWQLESKGMPFEKKRFVVNRFL